MVNVYNVYGLVKCVSNLINALNAERDGPWLRVNVFLVRLENALNAHKLMNVLNVKVGMKKIVKAIVFLSY